MATYTITSIDCPGQVTLDLTIGENTFTQTILAPTDSTTALEKAVKAYVKEYESEFTNPAPSGVPTSVENLVGNEVKV